MKYRVARAIGVGALGALVALLLTIAASKMGISAGAWYFAPGAILSPVLGGMLEPILVGWLVPEGGAAAAFALLLVGSFLFWMALFGGIHLLRTRRVESTQSPSLR